MDRSVLTIATGKKSYFDMACAMARSVAITNPGLPVYIVTDLPWTTPASLRHVHLIRVNPEDLPSGFSAKLHLDRFLQTPFTLFIDADCLVVGSLEPAFRRFRGLPVGVLGLPLETGEWCGDIEKTRAKLNLPHVIMLNGGVYYLEQGRAVHEVLRRARELEADYDKLGFVRLRGQANEEILVSCSVVERGLGHVAGTGEIYADFQWWPKVVKMNVDTGEVILENPNLPDVRHQSRYPATVARPTIIHFLGHHVESPLYRRCKATFFLKSYRIPLPHFFASMMTATAFIKEFFRCALRPVYRKAFGIRKIRPVANRLIIGE